jgi:hypothetical protein
MPCASAGGVGIRIDVVGASAGVLLIGGDRGQQSQTGPLVTDQRVRQGIDSRQFRGQFGVQAMTGGDRGG